MSTKWTRSRLSDVVDISGRVRKGATGCVTSAEEGAVAVSTLEVLDPNGDLEIANLHGFYGFETTAPTNQTCFYRGFVGDWTLGRGDFDRIGAGRRYLVESGDQNSILYRRIFRPTDTSANRPAETDAARIAWLLGTPQMTHIEDDTYVETSGAVAMDAADYRKQTPWDVLNDCNQASGKNFWCMFVESGGAGGGTFGLWYDFSGSEAYRTDLRISNVIADQDADTYYPFLDAEQKRIAQRVYSGMALDYDGGAVFVERDATGDAYQYRDTTAFASNVKTQTKAIARATRMLNVIKTPEDRITCTIQVPRDEINRLREGHGVECKFTHLDGYTDWTWMRVVQRTVSEVATDDFYTIKVEMTAEPAAPAASCSTSLSAIELSDSGPDTDGGGVTSYTPATPATFPCVVIAVWGGITTYTFLTNSGAANTGAIASPYTLLSEYTGNDEHTAMVVGYNAIESGSPGSFVPSWSGSGASSVGGQETLAVAVLTDATSPVQTGAQEGAGGSITLGAPPTAGNMLVMCQIVANSSGNPQTPPVDGWTRIAARQLNDGGVSDLQIVVDVRCVDEGESATVEILEPAFFHATSLSEWSVA